MHYPPYNLGHYPAYQAAEAYRQTHHPHPPALAAESAQPWPTNQPPCHRWTTHYPGTERHLQAIWADPRYRPQTLTDANGHRITLLNPGKWNTGAGPDFLDAILRDDTTGQTHRGHVEVHIHPSAWTAHRHQTSPAYQNIIAHVTWYAGPPPATLPATALNITLQAPCQSHPGFDLDAIDITAYPYANYTHTPTPCAQRYARPEQAIALLAAAGSYRIQIKAARLHRQFQTTPQDTHILYQTTLAVLGYQHHADDFRRLAQHIHPHPGETRDHLYARLLGAAGLLPAPTDAAHPQTQAHLQHLHQHWHNSGHTPLTPPLTPHKPIRPANHPARRLAAAAALFHNCESYFLQLLCGIPCEDKTWYKQVAALLRERTHWDTWEHQLTLTATPRAAPTRLLGQGRTNAIITNAIVPFLIAERAFPEHLIAHLPPEDTSDPQREMAKRLFGSNHDPKHYARSGLLQQGLLQLLNDHCRTNDTCADCPLANGDSNDTPAVICYAQSRYPHRVARH